MSGTGAPSGGGGSDPPPGSLAWLRSGSLAPEERFEHLGRTYWDDRGASGAKVLEVYLAKEQAGHENRVTAAEARELLRRKKGLDEEEQARLHVVLDACGCEIDRLRSVAAAEGWSYRDVPPGLHRLDEPVRKVSRRPPVGGCPDAPRIRPHWRGHARLFIEGWHNPSRRLTPNRQRTPAAR